MSRGIIGVLLAAGAGRRFGSDKLLYQLPDGMPMAVAAAAHLLPACETVVAVLRPEQDSLATQLASLGCEIVFSVESESGMGHSLAAGVRAMHDAAGWIVALADMPFIATDSHRAIVSRLQAGALLAAPKYQERRGHPVGFSSIWYPQLVTMTGDQGGKAILEQHKQEIILCPVDDPGVIWDIDRPEDLTQRPALT